jgi:hypothetical protein
MICKAFQGGLAIKKKFIDRLSIHWSSGRVVPSTRLAFTEASGVCSVMGATIEGTDVTAYEQQLGIPAGAAYLHEILLAQCGRHIGRGDPTMPPRFEAAAFARDYPVAWLQNIPVGADLSRLLPQFVAWMLHDLLDETSDMQQHIEPAVKSAGKAVSTLLNAFVAGEPAIAASYKQARSAAVKATDTVAEKFNKSIGTFVESIAWPPDMVARELHSYIETLWFAIGDFYQKPYFTDEDTAKLAALSLAFSDIDDLMKAPGADFEAIISERPALKAMLDDMSSPASIARTDAIYMASLPAVHAMAQRHFEALLQLTRAA